MRLEWQAAVLGEVSQFARASMLFGGSSSRLAALLASVVPTVGEPVVVELGPGTGAVSSAIAARLPRGSRHLAVELDPAMAAFLRDHEAGVEVINADASDLVELLAGLQISKVAAVVSGLPWSLFDPESQLNILHQVAEAMGSDGVFTTFSYAHVRALPSARSFRRALERKLCRCRSAGSCGRTCLPPSATSVGACRLT